MGNKKTEKQSETNKATLLIKEFLFKKGVYAWRNSVGFLKTDHGMYQMGKPGSSDLMAVLPPNGRFLGIELKKGSDRLRPEQEGFIKNVQAMGGGCITAYGNSAEEIFEDFKIQFARVEAFLKITELSTA